jgi:hypothetical protein
MSNSSSSYRSDRLREQIAHLRVLIASTEKDLNESRRSVVAWTERVMVNESTIASFWFRVNEHEAEILSLTRRPKAKK